MEGDHEKEMIKHICNLCNKNFPSGKSLGGHMRYHVMYGESPKLKGKAKAKAKAKPQRKRVSHSNDGVKKKSGNGVGGGHSGYGLRDNPKRTWRAGDSSSNQEKFCRECGKEFQSLRALFGHMSSHSGSKRASHSSTDHLWTESHSNTGAEFGPRNGGFSSVCDIEQVEEVAWCLIMLSRDSACRGSTEFVDKTAADTHSAVFKEDSDVVLFEDSGGASCFGSGGGVVKSEVSVDDEMFRNDQFEDLSGDAELGKAVITEEGYDQANYSLTKTKMAEYSPSSSGSWGSSSRIVLDPRFSCKRRKKCSLREGERPQRLHFGGMEDEDDHHHVIKQELSQISHVFDLNVPATLEE